MKKADRYSTHVSTHTPDIPGDAASRRERHRSAAVPLQLCGEQWRGEDVREVGVEPPSVRAQLLCGGGEVKLASSSLPTICASSTCSQHSRDVRAGQPSYCSSTALTSTLASRWKASRRFF